MKETLPADFKLDVVLRLLARDSISFETLKFFGRHFIVCPLGICQL